jgi:hypothetical protein
MLRRQQHFQTAAERVAAAFSGLPAVEKVVLFGSVALPLRKEVPRFREFRSWGIEVWHECNDVDLAVWLSDLSCLPDLQRARSQALKRLLAERNIGVAHHQVDVFLMSAQNGAYLGRLCWFRECPKRKEECLNDGCGRTPLLKQHDGFTFTPERLEPGRAVVLFARKRADLSVGNENDQPAPAGGADG